MEPESESISDMLTHMSIKEVYETFEVYIPEEVKYCPYIGSYEQMISKAISERNIPVVRSLIWYRDSMNEREKKIKELHTLLQN